MKNRSLTSSIKLFCGNPSGNSASKFLINLILGIGELLFSATSYGQVAGAVDQQLDALADTYVESFFEQFPEVATIRGVPDADHSSIRDPSPEAVDRWEARIDSMYERLQLLDVPQLSETEPWVTYGYLKQELETNIQTRVCHQELWLVDHINGWQAGASALASIQPVGNDYLREAALQRFGSLPEYVDEHINNLRKGLKKGYSSPRTNVELVLNQLDELLKHPPKSSPFYDPARCDSTPTFREAFEDLIVETIIPTIKSYRDFLGEEYLPEARTEAGISANPEGADCYQALLQKNTTLEVTPEEIHQLGLKTVVKLRDKIRAITKRSSDTGGQMTSRSSTFPEFFSSRSELLEAAKAAVMRARGEMPNWFGALPKADVVVVSTPSYLEASAPGGRYTTPAVDGSRPARFQINLYHANRRSRASLEKLSFHEAIPGHHLQRSIALERFEGHQITRYFGYEVFNEGWARYAEMLADEMGLYTSERARLVILRSQLESAHYLVLDTGLHNMGWTRRQGIDYLVKKMGGRSDNSARIIDHIIIWPGQITSYMIGYQEIQRLRAMAETELGNEFDIAQFHDLVLGDGSITLTMLREKVEGWISLQ